MHDLAAARTPSALSRQAGWPTSRLTCYEFPFLWREALELALFRTYSVPSISRLLVATREFELRCGKRYEDTDLIMEEILFCPLGSGRSDW